MYEYDVIVIGGGILGAMTARELSRYKLKILVLDKAYDIGEGSTKANSGILYPGFHHRGGSLKGISCVKGNAMYDEICCDLNVAMKRIGSLYVAFHPEGEQLLMEKYERGLQNGTPDMQILSGDEARRREPYLSEIVTKAIYAPSTAIISPFQLIMNTSLSAAENGVSFLFRAEVSSIDEPDALGWITVKTTEHREFKCRYIVNTAGGGASYIESLTRHQNLVIKPRRGQFYVFDKQTESVIRHVIFQAQEKDEGGTLIAPTIEGNIIAGPTSEDVRDFNRVETTRKGLEHIEQVAKKLIPSINLDNVITNFAGVRANIKNMEKEQKDFVLRKSSSFMVSALGIKNPGMTAAPYLSKLIVNSLNEIGLPLEMSDSFDPILKRRRPFLQETEKHQREMYNEDSRYAKIVCRCEGITEGDIIRELKSKLPPHSLNGFKKRLRTGMGRCQGGFCTSRIVEIYCRETGCEPGEFMKSVEGSPIVKGYLK